jgi:hypothetical protein
VIPVDISSLQDLIPCLHHLNARKTYESDRIIDLPGQPSTPSVSYFFRLHTVNEEHGNGRALFLLVL